MATYRLDSAKSHRCRRTVRDWRIRLYFGYEKEKQPPYIPLGLAAFGSYALVMATVPEYATAAAAFALIVAVAAGAAPDACGPILYGRNAHFRRLGLSGYDLRFCLRPYLCHG